LLVTPEKKSIQRQKAANKLSNIHFGSGLCAPADWINYDNSPTLRLQKFKLGSALCKITRQVRFPANVFVGSITAGLPEATGSAELIYCSHVIEHLAPSDVTIALAEVFRLLKPGGVFRLVLPDTSNLLAKLDSCEISQDEFLYVMNLSTTNMLKNPIGRMRKEMGGQLHRSAWTYGSLTAALKSAGFTDLRKARFGDSKHHEFTSVESELRWIEPVGSTSVEHLGLECLKPSGTESVTSNAPRSTY
jgi:SAM-dependent methyltransferase